MTGFLPSFHEDELVYSWMARYYCHSGYGSYSYAVVELLDKMITPDILFSNRLNQKVENALSKTISVEERILHHTMFPLARFASPDKLKNTFLRLSQGWMNYNTCSLQRRKTGTRLRYCPRCAAEDRDLYGETWWHRTANIPGGSVCGRHGCYLEETDIPITSRRAPRLHVAETEIPENTEVRTAESERERLFAGYVTDIFQAPVDIGNTVAFCDFLKSKLEGTTYLSTRGKKKDTARLLEDLAGFYEGFSEGIRSLPQLSKCFDGHNVNFHHICQLLFFLGVPTEEISSPVLPERSQQDMFDDQVASLYQTGLGSRRIARIVRTCPSTVLKAHKGKTGKKRRYDVRKGIRSQDWDAVDIRTLPLVQEACQDLYTGNDGRPGRVTQKGIEKILHLPERRLDLLPLSKQEVQKYRETWEEYWARKLVWAYRQLSEENMLTSNKLLRLINLRRTNLIRCVPYIDTYASDMKEALAIHGLLER